jgi:hypothetical protein
MGPNGTELVTFSLLYDPTWLDPKFAEGKNERIKTMFRND